MTLGTSRLGNYRLGGSGTGSEGSFIGSGLGTFQLGSGGGSGSSVTVEYAQAEIQTAVATPSGGNVTSRASVVGRTALARAISLASGTGTTTTATTATVASASGTVTSSTVTGVTSVGELSANSPFLPVRNGLVAYYEANSLERTNGTITGWTDLSGNGNDMTISGSPTTVATPTGQTALRFDGVNDKAVLTTLTNFPSGNESRSVFVAVRYNGPGWGGVGWGTNETNQVYGIGVDGDGELVVQAWGSSNDKRTNIYAPDLGWVTHASTSDGAWYHYLNGEKLSQGSHTYNTTLDSFIIGAEIDQNPFVEVDYGAVIIFDREVSEDERLLIEDYLRQKFLETRKHTASGTPVASNVSSLAAVEADSVIGAAFIEESTVFATGISTVSATVVTASPASSVALSIESATASETEVTASPIQGSMTARTSAFTAPVLARGVASEGAIAAVDSVGGRLTRLYSEVSPSAVVGVTGIHGTAPSETALPLSSDVYGSGLVSSDLLTVTGSPEPSSTLGIASVVAPRAVLEVSVLGGNAATREVVSANIASAQGVPSVGTLRLAFSRRTTGGESKFLMDSSNENQFFPK